MERGKEKRPLETETGTWKALPSVYNVYFISLPGKAGKLHESE